MPELATPPDVKLGASGKSFRAPPAGLADAMMAHASSGAPAEPPAKVDPPQPAAKTGELSVAPPAQPAAVPAPKPTPEPPKATATAPIPKNKQLRETLNDRDADLREAKDKLATLEEAGTATNRQLAEAHTKIAAAEDRYTKAAKRIEELEPLPQRLQETEKRLQEREDRLRIADYTSSQEWHDKHVKPMSDVLANAKLLLSDLVVSDADGNVRQATEADMNSVISAPNLAEAIQRGKTLFGDAHQTVVNVRSQIVSLQRNQREALNNAALESAEHQKRSQQNAIQEREQTMRSLHAKVDALFDAEPDIFKPKEDDAEAISALTEGKRFADSLLNATPDMSRDKLVESIATGRARIIKSFVQDKKLAKASEKIKALETELSQYRRSDPPVQTRTTPGQVAPAGGTDTRSRIASALEDHLAKR